jgi:hypothetical protein
MWPFKKKSVQEIERRSKEIQRAEDEKFWLRKMDEQRERLLKAIKTAEQKANQRADLKIQETQEKFQKKENFLKQQLYDAEKKVSDTQSIYLMLKEWIPKALSHANTLRSGLFVKQQEISQITGLVHGAEEGLEHLARELTNKKEKIEKDLHLGE